MKQCLEQVNWQEIYSLFTANEIYECITKKIKGAYDTFFPFKLQLNKTKNPTKLEMNENLSKMKISVSTLNDRYKVTGSEADKDKFTTANELFKKSLLQEISEIFRDYIKKAINQNKASWDLINAEKGRIKGNNEVITLKSQKLPPKIPDVFNSHFAQKPINIAQQTAEIANENHQFLAENERSIVDSFYLRPITRDEVLIIVSSRYFRFHC